jgi:hypothetical protein
VFFGTMRPRYLLEVERRDEVVEQLASLAAVSKDTRESPTVGT